MFFSIAAPLFHLGRRVGRRPRHRELRAGRLRREVSHDLSSSQIRAPRPNFGALRRAAAVLFDQLKSATRFLAHSSVKSLFDPLSGIPYMMSEKFWDTRGGSCLNLSAFGFW